MREIKFRMWDKETRQFFYWDITEKCPSCLTKDYIKKSSQLFTGLHDKNGKEIYEGDIVNWVDSNFQVDYGSCCFNIYNKNGDFIGRLDEYCPIEVIGNIYENPELLTPPDKEE